jgi:2'-5' RNA ligase
MLQKYFIAIVPPEPLLTQIRAIKQHIFETHQTKGALRSPAHITLHMPFSWEEDKEEKLIHTLQGFQFTEAFDICLYGFSCFEPRVVFIDVKANEQLFRLQKDMVRHAKSKLSLFNQAESMRGFHPHVTVAFRDLKKPQFYKVWADYKDKAFGASFNCESVCLLKLVEQRWEVYREFKFI